MGTNEFTRELAHRLDTAEAFFSKLALLAIAERAARTLPQALNTQRFPALSGGSEALQFERSTL